MSNPSKTHSGVELVAGISVDILRDRLDSLYNTLRELTITVKNVNDEIMALQKVLEDESSMTSLTAEEEVVAEDSTSKKLQKQPITQDEVSVAFLEAINSLPLPELMERLKNANAKQNVINNIIKERKNLTFQPFTSLEHLIERIKGLAKPSLDKIMNQWS